MAKKVLTVKDIVELIRSDIDHPDEEGHTYIRICMEAEEWTHVRINENSVLLDMIGDMVVDSIDADHGDICIWIKTQSFMNPLIKREVNDEGH